MRLRERFDKLQDWLAEGMFTGNLILKGVVAFVVLWFLFGLYLKIRGVDLADLGSTEYVAMETLEEPER